MSPPTEWSRAQRWLFDALRHPADGVDHHLKSRAEFPAALGLSVYANAYWLRLVACLEETFWATRRSVGGEAFESFAMAYLMAHPPSGPNLNTLGEGFADYLAETCPPEADDAAHALIDLARYEWAVDRVFDGPGAEGSVGLVPDELAVLDELSWSAARLIPHPALTFLSLSFAVDAFVSALREAGPEGPVPPLPSRAPRTLVLCRRDYQVRVVVTECVEHGLLERLAGGLSVGDAMGGLADEVSPDEIQRWFARWMSEALFVGLELR